MTDFVKLMPDVALALLGEPNARPKKSEWRYGNKGSLFVDVDKGLWKDFEADTGGGVLDLVEREIQTDRRGALDWLKTNGYVEDQKPHWRTGGRFKRRSSRPIPQRRTRAHRPKTPQKPKDNGKQNFALKLWAEAKEIGEQSEEVEHPFWMWATTGDKPNVLHPFCRVPPGIRFHRSRGLIIGGVFPLSDWGRDGIPEGEPVAVQALAIDENGENRYCLGKDKLRRRSYGPIGEGVFILGDPAHQRVSIVEGIADALAVYSREPGAVLATLGTSKTLPNKPDVIDWLIIKETWLYPDNDKAGDDGTEALIDTIKSKRPDARIFAIEAEAFDDPGDWAEQTPFAEIKKNDFAEKSGMFFDGGLSWGEADRMAVQHLNGER